MADNHKPKTLLGLDVGGTMIKALVLTREGEILSEETTPTNDDGTTGWRDRAKAMVQKLLSGSSREISIGVAAPGLASPDSRCITSLPNRLPGLEFMNWQEWLEFSRPVPVFNDAQAALLAEVWKGAARGASNVVLLTLGTGVGGAAIVDGRILRGHLGRAGHLGHVSLDPGGPLDIVNTPGSLEDAVGEHNVVKRTNGQFKSTRELVRAFEQGSKSAANVWLDSVGKLAAAITGFINVLDPEVLVIGGGIADANDSLFTPLRAALDRFEWRPSGSPVRIVKAALGRHAGAIGAAYGALLAHDAPQADHSTTAPVSATSR
jgi:glucokinase